MRVSDIFKVECPVLMSLICQVLWFAGNGIDLASGSADFFDDAVIDVTP